MHILRRHEEVDIAVGAGVPAGVRTEDVYAVHPVLLGNWAHAPGNLLYGVDPTRGATSAESEHDLENNIAAIYRTPRAQPSTWRLTATTASSYFCPKSLYALMTHGPPAIP